MFVCFFSVCPFFCLSIFLSFYLPIFISLISFLSFSSVIFVGTFLVFLSGLHSFYQSLHSVFLSVFVSPFLLFFYLSFFLSIIPFLTFCPFLFPSDRSFLGCLCFFQSFFFCLSLSVLFFLSVSLSICLPFFC